MAWYNWSRTASTNASADSTINMAEGMAPSAVNDGVRALMAASAKYRDDIAGAIATGGTSTAYTVTSYSVFDTLAHLDGQIIAFTPHTTNGATVTLSVDGLTAKPLRAAPSVELQTGALIQGTPYLCTYNNSNGEFYLHGNAGYNSYTLPLGGLLPYVGASAPNSAFALPYGQAVSRATYATLFTLTSTTFGVGDGSTTFNLPDLRGRVPAGLDNMGGSSAARLSTVISSTTLGASGGAQNQTVAQANLPNVSFTVTDPGHAHLFSSALAIYGTGNVQQPSTPQSVLFPNGTVSGTNNATTGITVASGGSGIALNTTQPTLMVNYILRII